MSSGAPSAGAEERCELTGVSVRGVGSDEAVQPAVAVLDAPGLDALELGADLQGHVGPAGGLDHVVAVEQTADRGHDGGGAAREDLGDLARADALGPLGEGDATLFRITSAGLNARVPQNIVDILNGTSANTVDAHAVQPYYTRLLAEACGLKVTLTLDGDKVIVAAA